MTDSLEPRCPCCGGTVEHYPDQDGACDWSCARCGWSQHVPGSADIVAAMTLHPEDQPQTGEQTDKHVCDDCGRTFSQEQLSRIDRPAERIEPGGTVPSGRGPHRSEARSARSERSVKCPDCGALCYQEQARRLRLPTRIIVHVRGGTVQGLSCSDQAASVSVADWDDAAVDDRARAECERLEEEAKKLHGVY
jgi:hypothetical protein